MKGAELIKKLFFMEFYFNCICPRFLFTSVVFNLRENIPQEYPIVLKSIDQSSRSNNLLIIFTHYKKLIQIFFSKEL